MSSDVNLSLYDFIKKLGSIKGLNVKKIKPISAAEKIDLIKPRFGGLESVNFPLINYDNMLMFFKGK